MKLSFTQEVALYNIASNRLPWDKNIRYSNRTTIKLKQEGLIEFGDIGIKLFGEMPLEGYKLTEKGIEYVKANPPGRFAGYNISFLKEAGNV